VAFATHNQFVIALSKALRVVQFDKNVFLDRVDANRGLMVKQNSSTEFLNLIERVYNHGAKKKRLPIAFLASEASRARQAAVLAKKRFLK
jgi:hypothetical protein